MKRFFTNYEKRVLLSMFVVFMSMASFSATYYVSATGNDSNTGLTETAPWKTLAKVNATAFKSGDQILFKRGDTFDGMLNIHNLKMGWTNVLTFGAYGTGAKPIINGFETITGWVSQGDGIYAAPTTAGSKCKIVTVNGVNTPIGRWPKSGWLKMESSVGTTSITDVQLPATPNWTGSEVIIKLNPWVLRRAKITNHSGQTITYLNEKGQYNYKPEDNAEYFIQGGLSALTQVGDWWISGNTMYMYFGSNNPSDYTVKAAKTDVVIDIQKNNVTIDGLRIEGANKKGVNSSGTANTIRNSDFYYMGHFGIASYISTAIVENNKILYCNGSAIYINSNNYQVRDNYIQNCGLFPGMIYNEDNSMSGIDIYVNQGGVCEYNTIYNTGYIGINSVGSNNIIRYNLVSWFCLRLTDGGGIYVNFIGTTNYPTGIKVHNNIVMNGGGEGLYSDAVNRNTDWDNNTVINCNMGILLNTPIGHNVRGNIIAGCKTSLNLANWGTNELCPNGTTIDSNLFVLLERSNYASVIVDMKNTTNILKLGTISSNIIYATKEKQSSLFKSYVRLAKTLPAYGLADWQQLTGFEKNSITNTIELSDMRLEYNSSKAPKTIALDCPYIDHKGNRYENSITLQPFTSAVLTKDKTVYHTEYKTICEGSSYNGWTVTGKYERKLVAASGADSIVTTHLTVNPKVYVTENITINKGENYKGWTTSGTYTRKLTSATGCDSIVTTVLNVVSVLMKQGEIQPAHFKTVWEGQNGLNHMNIVVLSASLENIPLAANDEIAVFCNSLCVGAKKLTQAIDPNDNTTIVSILASQNDGANNGFTNNTPIVFKIWDSKNQKEVVINDVVYKKDVASWKTDGLFSPSSTTVVEINSTTAYNQDIELLKGYNLISTFLTVSNPSIDIIAKPLQQEGSLVKIQDEAGNSYENWGESYGGWVNKVGSIEKTKGYKVQVATNSMIRLTGTPIALPLDLTLKAGWNIVSFPKTERVNAMRVIQSLIDENKLIKVQDEAGKSIENWGIYGGWKNNIGEFMPGRAYKVKVSSDAILRIVENYEKSALAYVKKEKTDYYTPSFEGNGTDHMNINITGLKGSNISVGDELAAFDGDVCVGTVKISNADMQSGTVSLAASFSTNDKNQNGFKVGNQIQLFAWNKMKGDESKVAFELISGQTKYEKNSTALFSVKALDKVENSSVNKSFKVEVYPNPCKERVVVRFSSMPEQNDRIEISDLSGRKMISMVVSNISEEIDLVDFTPGLYLVKSIIGANEYVHKLIVNK